MSKPCARLCHLKKVNYFDGYGFNLHNDKSRAGHFIGKVDAGSPAELAGLRHGDRVIEVNGVNITNENHQQVIERIKTVPNETKLLVVDSIADEYFQVNKIIICGEMSDILYGVTPDENSPDIYAKVSKNKPALESSAIDFVWPPHILPPRLCHVYKWSDFPGFGFSLNAEKGKKGQYVGQVDKQSPAEAAGLQEGDKILAVNDEVVAALEHQDVVTKIKAINTETRLLVARPETEAFLMEKNIPIKESMPMLVRITCPNKNPYESSMKVDNSNATRSNHLERQDAEFTDSEHSGFSSPASLRRVNADEKQDEPGQPMKTTQSSTNDLFAGSAAEARERMRRKNDVRNSKLSLKEKFEIYKKL